MQNSGDKHDNEINETPIDNLSCTVTITDILLILQVDGLHDEHGDSSDDSSEKLVIADDAAARNTPEKSPAKRKPGRPPKKSKSSLSPPATTAAAKKSKLMAVLNKATAAAGGKAGEDTGLTGKYWEGKAEPPAAEGRTRTRSRTRSGNTGETQGGD